MIKKTHPIENFVNNHHDLLFNFYQESFDKPRKLGCKVSFQTIVVRIIEILQLNRSCDEELTESFRQIYEKYSKLTNFSEFCQITTGWIISNSLQDRSSLNMRKFYLKYLKKLLIFYENLKKQSNAQDLLMIKDTTFAIEKEIYCFSQKYFDKTPSILFRFQTFFIETQGLREIFQFYALQHLFLGKFPTFSKIQDQKEVWDCGIFLIFCRHFQIHSENPKIPSLDKAKLIEIYKQNSYYCSQMNFEMFLRAFDDIALKFYNEQYDETSLLKVSHFCLAKKRILLLEFLKIGDLSNLKQKMKQFNIRTRPTAQNLKILINKKTKVTSCSKDPLKKVKIPKLFDLQNKDKVLTRHESISFRHKTSITRVSSALHLKSSHEKTKSYDSSSFVDRKIN